VIFDPYFGHVGQVYVRHDERINHPYMKNEDGSTVWLGSNVPITFRLSGYATSIVGPGPKGVGDKLGGRIEDSEGYDVLLSERGG
jgi:hypothetical protein